MDNENDVEAGRDSLLDDCRSDDGLTAPRWKWDERMIQLVNLIDDVYLVISSVIFGCFSRPCLRYLTVR
jgi:hypothetical protein